MAEYIERETLIKDIAETVVFTVRGGASLPTSEMRGANKVIDRIKSAPTANVVEVVRCGQCQHWKINPHNLYGGYCRYSECASIDHYCSYGKKKG